MVAVCLACPTVFAADAPRSHLVPAGNAATAPTSCAALGLSLSRASGVLRQQLALKRGAGLVVEGVAPGSTAARVGIAQHDVLVQLDDQLLVLPEQFDALLEAAGTDAPLACTVLRGGREIVVPITAGRQPEGGPPRGSAANGGLRPTASALAIVEQAAPKQGPIPAVPLRRLADETLVRHDTDYQIRLTSGDETRLMVSDQKGHVVFNDTIDTPEGRSRMPPVIRERVSAMERMLEGQRPTQPPAAESRGAAAEVGSLDVRPVELR
ncbi:MAG: hypothetical protein ACKO40_08995 [Planctomycetaceae bacterium]